MKLQVIPVGIYQTNCYLIEEEGLCIAVDPGDGDGAILRLSLIHISEPTRH